MKKLFLIFSSILLVLLFTGCGDDAKTIIEDEGSFNDLKVQGNKTYNFVTTEGKSITLKVDNNVLTSKQLEGKTVLLNFWATWCAPCLEEIPLFNKLYEKYNDKLEIIGILIEKNKKPEELQEFMTKLNMKFPVVVGDENYRAAKAFDDVKMFPESFVFGKDGKFLKKYVGVVDEAGLESLINKIK
ncbi:MAG: TlpA disulfide reductase family protein [Halarcobacter sp.]